jgi:preprotein translocase subunit SecE
LACIILPKYVEAEEMSEFKPKAFVGEVKEELSKVSWPTKEQTIGTSIVVLVVVVFLTIYLGVVDIILNGVITQILR